MWAEQRGKTLIQLGGKPACRHNGSVTSLIIIMTYDFSANIEIQSMGVNAVEMSVRGIQVGT
jgi:hypothetical protein